LNYEECGGSAAYKGSAPPAAAKSLVKPNDAEQLVQLDQPEIQLRLKQIAVGVKGIKLSSQGVMHFVRYHSSG